MHVKLENDRMVGKRQYILRSTIYKVSLHPYKQQ